MTKVRVFVRSEQVPVDRYEVGIAVPVGHMLQMPIYEKKVHFRQERVLDAKSKAAVLEARRLAGEIGCDIEVVDVSTRNFLSRIALRSMMGASDLPAVTVCGDHAAKGLKVSDKLLVAPVISAP
ncbi:MAG: hypothetical protein JRN62_02870 [Nitrososphaerota archaeon]|jgi:hypothetical protein|nr:hypothetical protein [Nitrososphaerota archaeon]MDG6948937.1 hypothetical protein [Nitrososphaerota archaeon]